MRRFLSLLTCAVRAGRIELHAYAFMLTHFHRLVRSVDGHISETMRRIQSGYVRYFNRTRHRDGPQMRGRFLSVPVMSATQACTVIRYIDQNPVDARIVARPRDDKFGSARHQRCSSHPRKVLCSKVVDQLLAAHIPEGVPRAEAYDRLAAVGLGTVPAWLRPYHALRNGERFRADMARIIAEAPEEVVLDEFTSVVDRQIARVGALAFSKAWRRPAPRSVAVRMAAVCDDGTEGEVAAPGRKLVMPLGVIGAPQAE